MFLNAIKLFFIKKSLNRAIEIEPQSRFVSKFKKIGLLIEDQNVLQIDVILSPFIASGIANEDITVLVYKRKLKPIGTVVFPTFGLIDIDVKGVFKKGIVTDFISNKFDLLISYYEDENPILLSVTKESKSNFKIGFDFEKYAFNDLSIRTSAAEAVVFSEEILKYSKILNKL